MGLLHKSAIYCHASLCDKNLQANFLQLRIFLLVRPLNLVLWMLMGHWLLINSKATHKKGNHPFCKVKTAINIGNDKCCVPYSEGDPWPKTEGLHIVWISMHRDVRCDSRMHWNRVQTLLAPCFLNTGKTIGNINLSLLGDVSPSSSQKLQNNSLFERFTTIILTNKPTL